MSLPLLGPADVSRVLLLSEKAVYRLVACDALKAASKRPLRISYETIHAYLVKKNMAVGLCRLAAILKDDELSINEAAKIIGVDSETMLRRVRDGVIPATRPGRCQYRIQRKDLAAYLRTRRIPSRNGRDSDRRLAASIMWPRGAAMAVASADPIVRQGTCHWHPSTTTSLFGLGLIVASYPIWCVVIDFTIGGRDAAYDAAERLRVTDQNPVSIGVAGEDEVLRPKKGYGQWDLLLTRPITAARLAAGVRELCQTAGPRP